MASAIGIDLSSSKTGLVILHKAKEGDKAPELLIEQEVSYPDLNGMTRYKRIATDIMELIHHHDPARIVIEGYSLNMKNASSVVPLCELGGIVRLMLNLDQFSWLDPRAGELKKFVMGSGNASKDQMMMYVLKKWGHTSKSNNTADAYGLACMGLAHMGLLQGMTKDMIGVMGKLKLRRN